MRGHARFVLVSLAVLLLTLCVPAVVQALADTTPPVTTDNADALWHNTDVNVTLTATDSESDPLTTYYSVDGTTPPSSGGTLSDPSTLLLTIVFPAATDHSNDGSHTLSYWSVDNAANTENPAKTCTVKIDTAAPTTTLSGASKTWYNASVPLTLVPADASSGPDETWYSIDGALAVQGTSAIVPGVEGDHSVAYWSVDNAGNVEATNNAVVHIDTHAPVTTVSGNDAKWHHKPVTLSFSGQDVGPAGVNQTQYKIDGHAWTTGTRATVKAPTNHSLDGIHTVYYRSTDAAGNVEAAKAVKVRIDTLGPTCLGTAASRAVTGTKVALHYRVNDRRSATANVTILIKKTSGKTVKTIKLVNRRTGHALSTSFVCKLASGSYHYYVYATDLAGNRQTKVGSNKLTVMPRVFSSLSASISDSSPARYSDVSAYARAKDQLGHALAGVKVTFTWHYKTTTPSETHYTNSSGVATCTRDISGASKKYHVVITMTATYKGVTKTTSTGFTPH